MHYEIDEEWELEGQSERLPTDEVFKGLATGSLGRGTRCRSSAGGDWRALEERFDIVERSDKRRAYGCLGSLGQGAYGTVTKALRLTGYSREAPVFVAIKRPTPALLSSLALEAVDPTLARRSAELRIGQLFSTESVLTARLALCPAVVQVLDHDVSAPFLVLEYCAGGSLKERMKSPYELEDALRWGLSVSQALVAAHGLRPDCLVHRDLKPDNLLLQGEELRVSDLGTSQMIEASGEEGFRGGFTPLYAAPEAWDGQAFPATDLWSLGVILYELLTGERPFRGGGYAAVFAAITKGAPPLQPKPGLTSPRELDDLVLRCLSAEPARRPSAAEAASVLADLLAVPSEPDPPPQVAAVDPASAFPVGRVGSLQDAHGRWKTATFSPTAEDLAHFPSEALGAGRRLLHLVGERFVQAPNLPEALGMVRSFLAASGYQGHSLLQVTIFGDDGVFLYHDVFAPDPEHISPYTISDVPAYEPMLRRAIELGQGLCYWEDFASNERGVAPEERFNAGFFGTCPRTGVLVLVEVHWRMSLRGLVAGLRAL